MTFYELHQQPEPLLICNVWDVASAQVAEKIGFKAIGTSSAAIAKMLGYQDGEKLEFSEMVYLIKRIAANTTLPLTVDIESGYSREPLAVLKNIKILADLGIAGINIEDSIVEKERRLLDSSSFAKLLETLREGLLKDGIDLFLNVRTDTFLLAHSNLLQETFVRTRLYEKVGADGIFVPCIEREEDIRAVAANTKLPLNVMCMPNLPGFDKLQEMNVKRISMGNFLFESMYSKFTEMLCSVKSQASFNMVFKAC